MRINWFSPLPPARSGIAHFTMQVTPLLARGNELRLWTDQDQVAPDVREIAQVVHYDPATPPWREFDESDISFYNLGNQPDFHSGIWQVSARKPGIVILHDLCLHDFFFRFWVQSRKDRASYLAALDRWYGEEGRQAGEAFCAGGISAESMAQRFPLTREATRRALGVITHAPGALEESGEIPACPVHALAFPYLNRASHATRRKASLAPYQLVVFGYFNRNRRLGAVLEALAGLDERERFRLDIYGQLWDEGHIRAQIEKLGLNPVVKLQGFLPENLVEQKLSTADLAINLRYPSMGEASLTQLQFWEYALPTLVTRTGWYRSLPEDAVAFVRPDHEVQDIQAHLRAFLAAPDTFRAMGQRGRESLKNYDAHKYADAVIALAHATPKFSPRIPLLELAERIGSDLARWLDPAAGEYLLNRASKEIANTWPSQVK